MDVTIMTETDEVLRSPAYIHQMAVRLTGLGLSRLKTPSWLVDVICETDVRLMDAYGRPLPTGDCAIDEAFDAAGWFSWASDVKRFAYRPPVRRARRSLLPRLRLLDVAFKLTGDPVLPMRRDEREKAAA